MSDECDGEEDLYQTHLSQENEKRRGEEVSRALHERYLQLKPAHDHKLATELSSCQKPCDAWATWLIRILTDCEQFMDAKLQSIMNAVKVPVVYFRGFVQDETLFCDYTCFSFVVAKREDYLEHARFGGEAIAERIKEDLTNRFGASVGVFYHPQIRKMCGSGGGERTIWEMHVCYSYK